MWELIQEAEAVPPRLLWDNETWIGRGKLTEAASAFAGVLGTEIKLLPPRDLSPREWWIELTGPFRRGFLPGRDFIDPHDFFRPALRLAATGQRPLRPLPRRHPSRPCGCGSGGNAPAGSHRPGSHVPQRDPSAQGYYVRMPSNDYSVDPSTIGRLVQVIADLDTVTDTAGTTVLARHERRWARHQIITEPAHVSRAAELRLDYLDLHCTETARAGIRAGTGSFHLRLGLRTPYPE
ncbi:Mu transposase domain-containing protein [Arthrobacter psychrolactophilus]